MTRKEKLAMWRARRLAAKAAEEEAADAERQVSNLPMAWSLRVICGSFVERTKPCSLIRCMHWIAGFAHLN